VRLIELALTSVLLLPLSGCATGLRQPPNDTGTVTVGVTTSGEAVAGLTFRVTIEPAGIDGTVRADAGVLTRSDVPPGDHLVRLLDVPSRCRVDGAAERTITIPPQGGSAVLRFQVVCD
jgi:hypothetical protein